MNKILSPKFFQDNILKICPNLLGKYLVRKIEKQKTKYLITEIEAYDGQNDLASHGRFGKTKRNKAMFLQGGHFYVYLIYGMYWMLNIVTGEKDYPAAILIRGTKEINGPGRLTKNLKINKIFDKQIIHPDTNLWIEENNIKNFSKEIIKTPRIGVDYAGPIWSKKLYRFLLKN